MLATRRRETFFAAIRHPSRFVINPIALARDIADGEAAHWLEEKVREQPGDG